MRLHRSVSRAVLGTVLATVLAGTAGPLTPTAHAVDDAGPPALKQTPAEVGESGAAGQADVAEALWRRTAPTGTDPAPTTRVIATLDVPGAVPAKSAVTAARTEVLDALPDGGFDVVSRFSRLPMVSLEVDADGLAALAADPLVEAVQADQTMHLTMTEANRVTRADQAHARGYTGEGTTVAVIDTGVDVQNGVVHPALADDLAGQQCFRTENDCIGGPESAKDQSSHGTHVAGIITGPQGVAPDARFYAFKVFTTGTTSTTNILNAMNRVVEINAASPGEIDEVNMSLGGGLYGTQAACDAAQPGYLQALSALNAQDVAVFVSTGNDARTNAVGSPGCVSGAIGVGSSADATFSLQFSNCRDDGVVDKVDCYSNATPVQGDGELVDLMAPGCNIVSTGLSGSTTTSKCGTSMASPYAAGVGALARQAAAERNQSFTPAELERWLEATGVGITDYRIPNSPTFPRVDALSAVTGDGGLPSSPTSMTATSLGGGTGVRLDWGFSREPDAAYAVERVQRGVATEVGTTTANTLADSPAACGPLTYRVRTVVGDRRSLPVSAAIQIRPCPTPSGPPTLRRATATSTRVTWTDSNIDEDRVRLERRLAGEPGFTTIRTLPRGSDFTVEDSPGTCAVATYRIAVDRDTDTSTSPSASRSACAPLGDDWADSPDLPLNTTAVLEDTRYASTAPSDPLHTCAGAGASSGANSVWWRFTPRANGVLSLSTAGSSGADNDTLLSVLTGMPEGFTSVACSEDVSSSDFTSRLDNLPLTRGTTYSVLVSRFDVANTTAAGTLRLATTWSPRAGATVSPQTFTVEEGVGSAEIDVALTVAPDAPVTVTPTGDDDCAVSPATLTFTPQDHATAQQVRVVAPDDDLDEGEHTCTVTAVAASADPDYEGFVLDSATGTVTDALRVTATVDAPVDGATYAPGQQVPADYECADNRGGAALVSCVGDVAVGSPVDTTTTGSHTFTVTATDVRGGTTTTTATYTVSAPDPVLRPDARVRRGTRGAFVGDDVYGGPKRQAVERTVRPGRTATFTVSLQNDGDTAERLLLRGQGGTSAFSLVYRAPDGTAVTRAVTRDGWRTAELAPGEQAVVTVQVTLARGAKPRARLTRVLSVASTLEPALRDRVRLTAERAR